MALARGRALLKGQLLIGNQRAVVPARTMSSLITRTKPSTSFSDRVYSAPKWEMSRAFAPFCNNSFIHQTRIATPPSIYWIAQEKTEEYSTEAKAVLLPEEVDFSKVIFGPPKKNAKGGQFVPVNYGSTYRALRVQTPTTRLPFGITKFDTGGYSINLSIDNIDTNESMRHFLEFINKFDDYVLTSAVREAKSWFPGKAVMKEVIEANFRRNIKAAKDPKYSPLMKLKIPVVRDQPDLEVYLETEPAAIEAITPNCSVISIIEPRSIWFVSGMFGISWSVRQTKILENESPKLTAYAFRDIGGHVPIRKPSSTPLSTPNPPPPVDTDAIAETEPIVEEEVEEEEEVVETKVVASKPAKAVKAEPKAKPIATPKPAAPKVTKKK